VKRPAFQFYPGDWQTNAKLKRCKPAEKSYWLDVMCLMHQSEQEYGVLRWPLRDIANAVGCTVSLLRGLADKLVLKGSDSAIEAFVYAPRHGGREGNPVVLLPAQSGPIWYCSRMVRDEYIRTKRGESTRFTAEPKAPPIPPFGADIGGGQGDGPSTPSSSSPSGELLPTAIAVVSVAACPHREIIALYHKHLPMARRVNVDLWNGARAKHLQTRWKEKPNRQNLAWWEKFFAYIAESDFLTGKVPPKQGHAPFEISLAWIVELSHFTDIIEGKYNRG
jgi:hypothetical protein